MSTPTTRRSGELIFNLVLLGGGLFLLWQAYGISGWSSITSAGAFPMAASALMVVTALKVLRDCLRLPREVPADGSAGDSLWRQFVRQVTPAVVVRFGLAITGYTLLLPELGFVVASYLFLVVSMGLLGSRRWGLNLLVSALSLAAIYLIFQTVFSVVLPSGRLLQGLWS